MKKCHAFWKRNVNSVTMKRNPKKLEDTILEKPNFYKKSQETLWKSEGFK